MTLVVPYKSSLEAFRKTAGLGHALLIELPEY